MYKRSFFSSSSPTLLTCRQILNHPGISHLIKVRAVLCLVAQLCPTLCNSMDCSPSGSSVLGDSHARILEWVVMPSSKGIPNPGIKPGSPALQVDSLPIESPGKPPNTGVGSLPLFQGFFPTQESNQGLLHCRQILYQLRYQGPQIKVYDPFNILLNSLC